eukprot:CAMPEP_0171714320 /NCGR_PEP_ID=MMETSP0991-20121206/18230_1 /TAXON_ID=483369 /ORGANISM="non described non described, Strain CCMP2098" /LENGTH=32 /DNA_ID= /DNA_START= /DNA_END= /DNA_ORIENTATION=
MSCSISAIRSVGSSSTTSLRAHSLLHKGMAWL